MPDAIPSLKVGDLVYLRNEQTERLGRKYFPVAEIVRKTGQRLLVERQATGSEQFWVWASQVGKCESCEHDWQSLPRESSLVEHDEVCSKCGAERDIPEKPIVTCVACRQVLIDGRCTNPLCPGYAPLEEEG